MWHWYPLSHALDTATDVGQSCGLKANQQRSAGVVGYRGRTINRSRIEECTVERAGASYQGGHRPSKDLTARAMVGRSPTGKKEIILRSNSPWGHHHIYT